jgi:monoamine oxidase
MNRDPRKGPSISRRRLLAAAVAGAARLAIPDRALGRGLAGIGGPVVGRLRRPTVVVLGAGVSGLAVTHELRRRGLHVGAVLEGQQRVGGRVATARSGFVAGQYAELGATRIPSHHDLTLGYVDEFGLPLAEMPDGPTLYAFEGATPFVHADGDRWPKDVLPGLAGSDATLAELLGRWARLDDFADPSSTSFIGDPEAPGWPGTSEAALKLDPLTTKKLLRRNGAPKDAYTVIRAAGGDHLAAVSALQFVAGAIRDAAWERTYVIAGGFDQLPLAFAAAHEDVVRTDCRVVSIDQDHRGVTVGFVRAGRADSIRADHVVCTLPFSTLRGVRITPQLPPDKASVVEAVRYVEASRSYHQVSSRFWEGRGIRGLMLARSDLAFDRIWDNTVCQEGSTAIVQAYMTYRVGLEYSRSGSTEAARTARILDVMAGVFPEIREQRIGGIEKIWHEDPWVGGAAGFLGPGRMHLLPVAQRPEGRLHFAGDHTTADPGWLQSSFESVGRVVEEIVGG